MRISYCSFADEKFKEIQKIQDVNAKVARFDNNFLYTKDWLIQTDFYEKNKNILDKKRNAGHCAWKPYIILDALNKIEDDEYLAYFDCGDYFSDNIKNLFKNILSEKDIILVLNGFSHSSYTKMDCFFYMNCFEEKYFNAFQLEAGIIVLKKNNFNINLMKEWLEYCCDEIVNGDYSEKDGNICKISNDSNFIQHQLDQSILTNLQIKYNIPTVRIETFAGDIFYNFYCPESEI